jgi:outer membrane biosynthesis protein TonB
MARASQVPALHLDVFHGGEFVRRETVSAPSITIGKGEAATLRIDHDQLAELHAVLNVAADGSVSLQDLSGMGGMTLDGVASSGGRVANGSTVGFGPIRILVAYTEEPITDETAMAASSDEDGDYNEDVMAFLLQASANDAIADKSAGMVLQIAQVFGDSVVDLGHFKRGERVVLGRSTLRVLGGERGTGGEHFFVSSDTLTEGPYTLFEPSGSGWVANVSDKWTGFVQTASGPQQLGGSRVEVAPDTAVVIDLGNTVFVARQVWPTKKVVAKAGEGLDYTFLAIMGFMTFVAVMFAVALAVIKPPPDSKGIKIEDLVVQLQVEPKKEEPKDEKKPDRNPDAGEGAKAKKEEGKVGKKDAKMQQAKGEKVQMQKQQLDREVAENAGLLGAMRDDALSGVLGNSAVSADLQQGIGGLIGAKGTQIGSGGLGARGSGLGGGGTAEGLGGAGTKGRGAGASGYGSGGGNFGAKGEGGIGAGGGETVVLGALDKSLIDKVIKSNMAQIRYCYQRELSKNPSLGGKIAVNFTIAKDGTVSAARTKSSTMGNPTVEQCINGRFMRFQFPEPKGGGIVIVTYPFIFSPG